MKRLLLPGLLLGCLLLFAPGGYAGSLCNAACTLTISFPNGGSIVAVEPLQITFGDGGLIDTVGSVTAYVSGETRLLAAGESLDFEAEGTFSLGNAGNLEYSNLTIITDGVIQLLPAAATDEVTLPADSMLTLSGDLIFDVFLSMDTSSQLVIGGGSMVIMQGTIDLAGPASPGSQPPGWGAGTITASATLNVSQPSTLTVAATIVGGDLIAPTGIAVISGGTLQFSNTAEVSSATEQKEEDGGPDGSRSGALDIWTMGALLGLLLAGYRRRCGRPCSN